MTVVQPTFRKPARSDWALIAILWILAFPFVIAGNMDRSWWLIVIGWAFEVIVHSGVAIVMVYGLFPAFLFTRRFFLLFLSLLITLLTFATLHRLGIWLLYDSDKPFRWFSVLNSLVSIASQGSVLASILTGKQFFETQQRLVRTEKERTEAELRHLKAQIDPHFLFNNLNVLGALIERSPEQASAYLHRFSALYRYLIRHKDDDVVPLADELAFLSDYTYLIRQRFGRAYEIVTTVRIADTLSVLVLPGSLQTLVENAVKHNQSSEAEPLLIELTITDLSVVVRNELRPKLTPVDSMGTGLRNVQARYQLLSDRAVLIQPTATEFVVTLPMLRPAVVESKNPWIVTQ